MILLDHVAIRVIAIPSHRQAALGQCVDTAVGALERRDQQSAANQTARIARGAHSHVQRVPLPREGGQRRADHHDRHVAALNGLRGNREIELGQDVGQRLTRRAVGW
ncbi:hypothetical protein D3C71_1284790 [compost metagenome]